jgi:hypothetical protein
VLRRKQRNQRQHNEKSRHYCGQDILHKKRSLCSVELKGRVFGEIVNGCARAPVCLLASLQSIRNREAALAPGKCKTATAVPHWTRKTKHEEDTRNYPSVAGCFTGERKFLF